MFFFILILSQFTLDPSANVENRNHHQHSTPQSRVRTEVVGGAEWMGSSKETNTSCHSQKGYLYSKTLKFEAKIFIVHWIVLQSLNENYLRIWSKNLISRARIVHQCEDFLSYNKEEVLLWQLVSIFSRLSYAWPHMNAAKWFTL